MRPRGDGAELMRSVREHKIPDALRTDAEKEDARDEEEDAATQQGQTRDEDDADGFELLTRHRWYGRKFHDVARYGEDRRDSR